MFSEKLKKVQDDDAVKKKAQQQQDSIIEMMKMQMRDAQERADKQLEEALNRPKSASSVATDPEIYDLREEVEKLENKLDDMMNQLEDRENENRRLATDIEDLNEQLNGERRQVQQLKKELSDALLAAEHERNNFRNEHKLSSDQASSNKCNEVKTVDQTTMFFLVRVTSPQINVKITN
ncbi:anucleate primary sterigmata protein B-like [Orbicella faveolata]|uniref:anucleate primary sterigmata protein B-like n=1 Tax=Orbicella faveolata TaxID=48498 RepID=UPI0009E1FB1F|nr:anucleate primary sterigmata protein B-like [Orbicella faveolata]